MVLVLANILIYFDLGWNLIAMGMLSILQISMIISMGAMKIPMAEMIGMAAMMIAMAAMMIGMTAMMKAMTAMMKAMTAMMKTMTAMILSILILTYRRKKVSHFHSNSPFPLITGGVSSNHAIHSICVFASTPRRFELST